MYILIALGNDWIMQQQEKKQLSGRKRVKLNKKTGGNLKMLQELGKKAMEESLRS